MLRALGLIAAGIYGLPPVPGKAQTIAELRHDIEAAQDTATLGELIARHRQWLSESAVRYNIVQGFAALRRAELAGERQAIDSAAAAFRRALDLDAEVALAHLGRGLTLLRDPGIRRSLVATGRSWSRLLGFDARARARRSFVRALELDPAVADAAVALGEIALETQDPAELAFARDALARTLAAGTADPSAIAMLMRVASAVGDSATANGVIVQLTPSEAGPETLHSILWALAGMLPTQWQLQ